MIRSWGIAGVVLFMGLLIGEIVLNIQYDRKVTNELQLAANASTVEIAIEKMDLALEEIEKRDLTEGYTSIFYRTPDEDIGYWYDNLKTALDELKEITPEDNKLLRSNMLLKLRETILYYSQNGSYVQQPSGIHKYPYNKAWFLAYMISIVLVVTGFRLGNFF